MKGMLSNFSKLVIHDQSLHSDVNIHVLIFILNVSYYKNFVVL